MPSDEGGRFSWGAACRARQNWVEGRCQPGASGRSSTRHNHVCSECWRWAADPSRPGAGPGPRQRSLRRRSQRFGGRGRLGSSIVRATGAGVRPLLVLRLERGSCVARLSDRRIGIWWHTARLVGRLRSPCRCRRLNRPQALDECRRRAFHLPPVHVDPAAPGRGRRLAVDLQHDPQQPPGLHGRPDPRGARSTSSASTAPLRRPRDSALSCSGVSRSGQPAAQRRTVSIERP
jgi:hypothetical protein